MLLWIDNKVVTTLSTIDKANDYQGLIQKKYGCISFKKKKANVLKAFKSKLSGPGKQNLL